MIDITKGHEVVTICLEIDKNTREFLRKIAKKDDTPGLICILNITPHRQKPRIASGMMGILELLTSLRPGVLRKLFM